MHYNSDDFLPPLLNEGPQCVEWHNGCAKNTGVKLDPERVHWGQTPFRVNDDPDISQLDAEYDPELYRSIWPYYLSSLQKAEQIPGHFWPGT